MRISPMKLITSIFFGATFIALLANLSSFILFVLLARWLTLEEFGKFTLAFSWIMFLRMVTTLGYHRAILKLLPVYRTQYSPNSARALLSHAHSHTITAACATAFVITICICIYYAEATVEYSWLLFMLAALPVAAVTQVRAHALRAWGNTLLSLTAITLNINVTLILSLYLIFIVFGEVSLFEAGLMFLVSNFVNLGLISYYYPSFRIDKRLRDQIRTRKKNWQQLSLLLMLAAAAGQFLPLIVILVSGPLLSTEQLGLLVASHRIALFINLPLFVVGTIVAPLFAGLYAKSDQRSLRRLFVGSQITVVACVGLSASIVVYYAELILTFFGPEFAAATKILIVLVLFQFAQASFGPIGELLAMTNFERHLLTTNIFFVMATTFGALVSTYIYAIWGAIITTSLLLVLHKITLYVTGWKKTFSDFPAQTSLRK